MPKQSHIRAAQAAPLGLFDVQNAGTSFLKTLWPNGNTVTLPSVGSGQVAPIQSGGNNVGGVFAPSETYDSVLMDFAAVGAASQQLVVEIGRLAANGDMPTVLCTVTLTSIVTSGTIANVNPFTGVATAGVTWRLFDLVSLANKGQLAQVLTNVGGAQDNTPSQLVLDLGESPYYYAVVTNLNALTRAICAITPQ